MAGGLCFGCRGAPLCGLRSGAPPGRFRLRGNAALAFDALLLGPAFLLDPFLFGARLFGRGAIALLLPRAIPFQPPIEKSQLFDVKLERRDMLCLALRCPRGKRGDEATGIDPPRRP